MTLGGTAQAAGIAVDTQGGRATGLATAVVANIDDPSAIFYNPAGMLHGEELQLAVGGSLILPTVSFTSQAGKETSAKVISPPPHLYVTAKLSDSLSAGIGMATNYGASGSWPDDFEFRWRAYKSKVAVYTFNPSVAYAVGERLRLGAGLQVVRGALNIQRKLNFVDSEGAVTLDAGTWGVGFNAGAQVDVVPDKLSLGLAFRSSVTLGTEGTATFSDIPVEMSGILRSQSFSGKVVTPDTVFIGLSYQVTPALMVAADAHLYRWSSIKALVFEFEDPALNQNIPKNWRDTFNYHLGAEYKLGDLSFRAGAVYDPTPSPDDTLTMDLPDATRVKGALGVGYGWGRMQVDVGYQYVHLLRSTSTYPGYEGSYGGNASVLGVTMGYRP